MTHPAPARDYIVGGVNAPQQAIYDFLKDDARPAASPPSAERGRLRRSGRPGGLSALAHRPPLLTRGVVEIFSHDWSLDSIRPAPARTPLNGLSRTLATGAGV